MKTQLLLFTLFLLFIFSSCGSSKKGAKPNYHSKGDIEIDVPCTGPEYRTNKDFFRANASGISNNMDVANQKAQTSARAKLAANIESKIKAVSDTYASSYEQNTAETYRGKFQSLIRTVVNQTLQNSSIICEKTMKGTDGQFKSYVAVEVSKESLNNKIIEQINNDSKLRTDFEYERFKKIFKEEMSKLESE